MHSDNSHDVDFARTRHQPITHHAHHRARHHAEVLFKRRPALHRADLQIVIAHKAIDHRAELRHLNQRRIRHIARRDVRLDIRQLLLRRRIVCIHSIDAAQNLRQIDRHNRDVVRLEQFFAIANRVERSRPGADRAYAQVAQPTYHAADRNEPPLAGWRPRPHPAPVGPVPQP